MELITFAIAMLLVGMVIGGGVGYYVASHIHSVANAAATVASQQKV